MESLERFHQSQRVIDDFTSTTLAAIPSDFGRLVHIATLRDLISGQYKHEGLEALYSAPAVHEALYYCHEEIFQKILEIPLERQERLLRSFFGGSGRGCFRNCRTLARTRRLPHAGPARHARIPARPVLL